MPFNLFRVPSLPDARATKVQAQPMPSGHALVSWVANDLVCYGWADPFKGTIKVLDDDLFDQDWRKDADGVVWPTPRGLAALVSHTTDATGSGTSARLHIGHMDAPWIGPAQAWQAPTDPAILRRVAELERELTELKAALKR